MQIFFKNHKNVPRICCTFFSRPMFSGLFLFFLAILFIDTTQLKPRSFAFLFFKLSPRGNTYNENKLFIFCSFICKYIMCTRFYMLFSTELCCFHYWKLSEAWKEGKESVFTIIFRELVCILVYLAIEGAEACPSPGTQRSELFPCTEGKEYLADLASRFQITP